MACLASGLPLAALATAPATPPETYPLGRVARSPTTKPNDSPGESNLFPHEDTLCGPFDLYLACRSYGITKYSAMALGRMGSFTGPSTSSDRPRQASDRIGLHALSV